LFYVIMFINGNLSLKRRACWMLRISQYKLSLGWA